MKIFAAIARGPKQAFSLENIELEAPRDNEVLVAIKGVGLCHTDITSKDYPVPPKLPAVLGHEGAGIVLKTGAKVTHIQTGDAVILSFAHCGHCHRCQDNEPGYCDHFFSLNQLARRSDRSTALRDTKGAIGSHFFGQSSFASHAVVAENQCIKVDASLPIEQLGPLACGVQTGAGTVMLALNVAAHSSLLIMGGGTVGLSALLAGVVRDCKTIVVVEPVASRRQLALELGATHVLDPTTPDSSTRSLSENLASISPQGFDYILDTTARANMIETALTQLAIRGTLALVAFPSDSQLTAAVPIHQIMMRGQRIIGVIEGDAIPKDFIPKLLTLYQKGQFPFDKLITQYPFSEINQAVEDQHAGHCVKPVLLL